MSLLSLAARSARRFLLPSAVALLLLTPVAPVVALTVGSSEPSTSYLIAEETTTSSTESTDQTAVSPEAADTTSTLGVQAEQTGMEPPSPDYVPLNPGWMTDQIEVRVQPEYDERAVLVIMRLALPADVQLPATLRLPVPAGAWIVGIGEIAPDGRFVYNYTDSYPVIEPGVVWETANIEVKDYRQLQVDYYYDPGLPVTGGSRAFPLLVQMPMDAATLILHVQQPLGATDFQVHPLPQGMGAGGDGFNYAVSSFSEVKAGSTLAYLISYDNPEGKLSIEAGGVESKKVNTTTVLLAAILIVVVLVGGILVYRMYSNSRGSKRKKGRPGGQRTKAASAKPRATKQQSVDKSPKGKAPKDESPDSSQEKGETAEYCVACGEELTGKARFCSNCGEARP